MIIDTQLASHDHIVRTTQQWESSAVKYKIISNGCFMKSINSFSISVGT